MSFHCDDRHEGLGEGLGEGPNRMSSRSLSLVASAPDETPVPVVPRGGDIVTFDLSRMCATVGKDSEVEQSDLPTDPGQQSEPVPPPPPEQGRPLHETPQREARPYQPPDYGRPPYETRFVPDPIEQRPGEP